jgi:hypothetical protein
MDIFDVSLSVAAQAALAQGAAGGFIVADPVLVLGDGLGHDPAPFVLKVPTG